MVPPCENYLPESPAMQDENEGASGDVPAFDETALNANRNDDVMPNPENGNDDHIIEKLREKMIEQNAIFREQLFQLHHAYKVQENMMDVFKMKGPLKGLVPIDASLMIPVLDQIPSEITNMIPPNNHLPEKSTPDVGIAIADTDDFKMPWNILQVNDAGRSSVFLPPNDGVGLKDADSSNPNVTMLEKRKFSRVLEANYATESPGSLTPMVNSVLPNNGEPSELRPAKSSKWMSMNALKENEAIKSSVSPVPEQNPMQLKDSEPSDRRTKEFIDRVSSMAKKVFAERMSTPKCLPKKYTAFHSSASPLPTENAVLLNDAESAQLKKREFSKGMSSWNAVKANGAVESSVSPAPKEVAVFLNDNESVELKKRKFSECMSSPNILKMNDATYGSLSLIPRENPVWLQNGESADSKTRELSKKMSSNALMANNANHVALYSVPMLSGPVLKEGESSDTNKLALNNLRENDARNSPVLPIARVNEVSLLADKSSDTKMIISPKRMSVTSIKAYARSKPVSLVPKADGVLLQDGESSGSKKRKRRRRVIDLELPAEAYIDLEDTDVSEEDNIKPSDSYEVPVYHGSENMHENDETLTLGTDANPNSSAFHLQSSLHSQNLLPTQGLAYSNKPVKDASNKRTRSPVQYNFLGTNGNNMEVQEYGNLVMANPNILGQQMVVVDDKHEGEGSDSNYACANNKRKREFPLCGSEAGQSENTGCSFSLDLFTRGSLGSSVKNEHVSEKYVRDQSRGKNTLLMEKSANATENAKINPHFANPTYSRLSVSKMGTPFFVSGNEYHDSAYPMVLTSKKSVSVRNHSPAAGQPLPSFTGFSPIDVRGDSSKLTSQNQTLSNAGASQAPLNFTRSSVMNAQHRSSISTSQGQNLSNAGSSQAPPNFTGSSVMNAQGRSSISTSQNQNLSNADASQAPPNFAGSSVTNAQGWSSISTSQNQYLSNAGPSQAPPNFTGSAVTNAQWRSSISTSQNQNLGNASASQAPPNFTGSSVMNARRRSSLSTSQNQYLSNAGVSKAHPNLTGLPAINVQGESSTSTSQSLIFGKDWGKWLSEVVKSQSNRENKSSLHLNGVVSGSHSAPLHLQPTSLTLAGPNPKQFGNNLASGSTEVYQRQTKLTGKRSKYGSGNQLVHNQIHDQLDKAISEMERRLGVDSGGFISFRKKRQSNELDENKAVDHHQMRSSNLMVAPGKEQKRQKAVSSFMTVLPDSALALEVKERKHEKKHVSDELIYKGGLRFPEFNEIEKNNAVGYHQMRSSSLMVAPGKEQKRQKAVSSSMIVLPDSALALEVKERKHEKKYVSDELNYKGGLRFPEFNKIDENNAVGYHQMRSSSLMVAPGKEQNRQKAISSSMTVLPDSALALEVKERKHEKKYLSDELNCKGGLRFPEFNEIDENNAVRYHQMRSHSLMVAPVKEQKKHKAVSSSMTVLPDSALALEVKERKHEKKYVSDELNYKGGLRFLEFNEIDENNAVGYHQMRSSSLMVAPGKEQNRQKAVSSSMTVLPDSALALEVKERKHEKKYVSDELNYKGGLRFPEFNKIDENNAVRYHQMRSSSLMVAPGKEQNRQKAVSSYMTTLPDSALALEVKERKHEKKYVSDELNCKGGLLVSEFNEIDENNAVGHHQMRSSSLMVAPGKEQNKHKAVSSSMTVLPDSALALEVKERKNEKKYVSDELNRKGGLRFPEIDENNAVGYHQMRSSSLMVAPGKEQNKHKAVSSSMTVLPDSALTLEVKERKHEKKYVSNELNCKGGLRFPEIDENNAVGYHQMRSSSLMVAPGKEQNKHKAVSSSMTVLPDSALALEVKERKNEKKYVSDELNCKGGLRFPEIEENNAAGYHQMRSSSLMVAPGKEQKKHKAVSSSMTVFPDSALTLEVKERKHEKEYASDELHCNGGLHFPVADQVQQNALFTGPIAHSLLSLSSSSKNNDMNGNLTIGLSSEIKAGSSKERTRSVNLLSRTQPCDDTKVNKSHGHMSFSGTLVVSQKPPKSNEVAPFLLPALPGFSAEASAGNEAKHSMLSQSTSDTKVRLPLLKAKSSKDYACINDPVLTAAAASILALSSDTTTCPLPPSSSDSLLWFAEIVSSMEHTAIPSEIVSSMEHTAVPNNDVKEYSEDDGWFEVMTLQLEEVKEEEYMKWTGPVRVEAVDYGEKSYTSLLFTKRRRGAPRGRRQQRREFRSEVLPSIVTLSRQEVAEDFQNIGAMMKAEGLPWPLSSSTRGRGRNRRGRGRLAARNVSYAEDDPTTDARELKGNKRATRGGRGRRGRRGRR